VTTNAIEADRALEKDPALALQGSWTRRAVIAAMFLALAVVTWLWFRGWAFHTWMGDDLYLWAFFQGHPSVHDVLFTSSGGKYRPVATGLQWIFFQLFSPNFPAWTYANAVIEWAAACLVFFLVRSVTRRDIWIAFAASVLFLTSRFSYYGVLQAMGTMEALGMLLFVVLLLVAVFYCRRSDVWSGVALAAVFLALSLTHERYLAVLPFLVALALLMGRRSWALRGVHAVLFCVPLIVNLVLKMFVFTEAVLMGTGGQAIGLDPASVAKFLVKGAANLVWFNWGPDYLSGITMSETGTTVRVVVAVIVALVAVCVVSAVVGIVRSRDKARRRLELKVFVLWVLLTGSLLVVASITIRQEYRWLYAPWAASLVYFMYLYARLRWRVVVRYAVLAVLVVAVLGADVYYRAHESNVFFFYGERIADSARAATVGVYDKAMLDKTIYFEKSDEDDWLMGHDLLLSPYLGLGYRKIVWLDSFDKIHPADYDPERSVFLRLDWPTKQMVDVTRQVLGK
jgi:hypothetical protein